MTIDVNMQLSHMLADEVGANGDETVVIDALHLSTEPVTVDSLPAAIEAGFHVTISIERVRGAVRRMVGSGKIINNGGYLSLSPSTLEEINRIARDNKSIEDEALSQWCASYAAVEGREISEEWIARVRVTIITFISKFFLMHGADCYGFMNGSKTQDISKLDVVAKEVVQSEVGIDQKKMGSFLASIFTQRLTTSQESFLLLRLKKAIHYLSMVVDSNTMRSMMSVFSGVTVYLDTSILYRLLNLQGSHRYESIRALITFCQQANMNVSVLQCSIEELKRRIRYDARVIEAHPTPIAFSAIGYKCRSEENYISTFWRERSETGISAKDFNFRYHNILPHLDEFGIKVDERDYISELNLQAKYAAMRLKIREFGVFDDGEKSENAVDHDSECLTIVEELQRKNAASAIEARTMFLSTDWSLVRLQRYDHEYKEKTDLVALPSQLMQIFCLSTPTCDYFEAFLGLFASSHTTFGTRNLNNTQIQEILGRVAAYSDRPQFAEKVLTNQVILSKFTEQETDDQKNAVIDDAILAEIEQMETALEQQNSIISQKDAELGKKREQIEDKDRQYAQLHKEKSENERRLEQLSERLERVLNLQKDIETKNDDLLKYKAIVEGQKETKRLIWAYARMIFGTILFLVGLVPVLLSIGALLPFMSPLIDPIFTWLKTAQSMTGESTVALIGVLLALAAIIIPSGIAIIKIAYKGVSSKQQKIILSKKESNPEDKQVAA